MGYVRRKAPNWLQTCVYAPLSAKSVCTETVYFIFEVEFRLT